MEAIIFFLIVLMIVFMLGSQQSQSEELVAVVKGEEPGWFAGCSGYLILGMFACGGLALLILLGGGLQ